MSMKVWLPSKQGSWDMWMELNNEVENSANPPFHCGWSRHSHKNYNKKGNEVSQDIPIYHGYIQRVCQSQYSKKIVTHPQSTPQAIPLANYGKESLYSLLVKVKGCVPKVYEHPISCSMCVSAQTKRRFRSMNHVHQCAALPTPKTAKMVGPTAYIWIVFVDKNKHVDIKCVHHSIKFLCIYIYNIYIDSI